MSVQRARRNDGSVGLTANAVLPSSSKLGRTTSAVLPGTSGAGLAANAALPVAIGGAALPPPFVPVAAVFCAIFGRGKTVVEQDWSCVRHARGWKSLSPVQRNVIVWDLVVCFEVEILTVICFQVKVLTVSGCKRHGGVADTIFSSFLRLLVRVAVYVCAEELAVDGFKR